MRTVAELRAFLRDARRAGPTVGLVITQPTLGALHEGHLSLIRRAREVCDVVVVSLNPARGKEGTADRDGRPRDLGRDAAVAATAGADVLFAPPPEEVYPPGFATEVRVRGLTERLEGACRGVAHFDGVTTIVTKLLNMVRPDVAFVGQKDAQQALVIRRLVRDLDLPVRIELCPAVREPDGLVVSSRNELLAPAERRRATALWKALRDARRAAAAGAREPAVLTGAARAVLEAHGVEPEYLELVSADTLEPVRRRVDGDALLLVAARFGGTRLIDNVQLSSDPPA